MSVWVCHLQTWMHADYWLLAQLHSLLHKTNWITFLPLTVRVKTVSITTEPKDSTTNFSFVEFTSYVSRVTWQSSTSSGSHSVICTAFLFSGKSFAKWKTLWHMEHFVRFSNLFRELSLVVCCLFSCFVCRKQAAVWLLWYENQFYIRIRNSIFTKNSKPPIIIRCRENF